MDNYDAIANNYNEFEQNAITLWRLGYPVVTDLLGNVNGKSVLDYGCGTGTFSRFLQSKKASVTGVDVSENMIEVAKSNSSDKIAYFPFPAGGDLILYPTICLISWFRILFCVRFLPAGKFL